MFARSIIKSGIPRSLSRCISQVTLKPNRFATSSISVARHFSSNKQSIVQELATALQNEIDAEKRLEAENLGGSAAPSIPGFSVSTNDAEVRLSKTYGSEKILVVFNVNHSVDISEDIDNVDNSPVPVALPPFTIEITKGNERLCFQMLLDDPEKTGNYDYCVEEFYIAPAVVDDVEDVESYVYSSSGKYVDEALHDLLFDRYLGERGFTPEFCNQLVNFATHYEHSRYVNLLSNIKNFVIKK